MIQHIVLVRFRPGTGGESVVRLGEELRALKGKVPGVLGVQCGRNFSDRAQGWEYGLTVQLENRAALQRYRDHPAHRTVVEQHLAPVREDSLAVDVDV